MACSCRKNTKQKVAKPQNTEPVNMSTTVHNSEIEAKSINLPQCYECAKKHLSRAKEEFKEYHTGYPGHIKNLIQSIRVSEAEVRRAFLKWEEIQGQLDMSAGELLGSDANQLQMREEHISLANRIREERLKLNDNPLYVPEFDDLLVAIHQLEYQTLESL